MQQRKKGRNREDGHSWEREVVKDLSAHGYQNAATARSANRMRDAQKVDIVNKDEHQYGRMFDDVQAKSNTVKTGIPWQILLELEKSDTGSPKRRKVLALKLADMITNKAEKRQKVTKGKFAMLFWRDYLQMLKIVKKAEQLVILYDEHHPIWKHPLLQQFRDTILASKRQGHG